MVVALDARAYAWTNSPAQSRSQGRVDSAARLWGASEALREDIGTPRSPALAVAQVEAIAQAAARADGDDFAAAWAHGRAMDGAAALAYALAVSEE